MNDMFKKMLEDKKGSMGKEMSPVDKQATGDVLHDLMSYLSSLQGDKVKGLKKVTVASNDPKGLVAGLAKAKDMVKDGEDGSEDESSEDPMEELMESPEDEHKEEESEHDDESHDDESHDDESPEALKKQIEMLKSQLASRK